MRLARTVLAETQVVLYPLEVKGLHMVVHTVARLRSGEVLVRALIIKLR